MRHIKLKYAVELVSDRRSFDEGDRYLGLENIESWTGGFWWAAEPKVEGLVGMFRFGDILFGKLRPYLAKIAAPDSDGVCSTEALILRPKSNARTDFFRYVLSSSEFIARVNAATFGSKMPRASWENIGSELIPLPDLATQKAIADFLDRETARIDLLIEKKQRLVEVLGVRFNASRNNAFRRIPNSKNRPMRWMISQICDGPFGSGLTSSHYADSGVRVIRLQNIKDSRFDDTDVTFISEEHYASLGDHDVAEGDLLIAGLGDDKNKVGRACVVPHGLGPAMVKADCYRVRLDLRLISHAFAAEYLSSDESWAQIDALAKGVTRTRLNLELVRRIRIPVPSLSEQHEITVRVNAERAAFSSVTDLTSESITRLRKYRAALITAAVTGQIDVATYGKQGTTDHRLDQIEAGTAP
jgi:type I restriction enzyme, S subunit